MNPIQILDCTLRDGGYLVDSQFGDEYIRGFISHLSKAGIDEIECGFLKDIPHEAGSTIFNHTAQVEPYLPQDTADTTHYVLLADYGRYNLDKLEPYHGKGVDTIRACFFKKDRKNVLPFCEEIQAKGYRLYVQPVDALGYSDEELLDLLKDTNELSPYAFSIVDTFGSMYTDDLRRLFFLVDHNLDPQVKMAFHSHNNLQLSFALSQEFIALGAGTRAIGIDATMCGMGRGAGNANTELIANFLNQKYYANYDIDILLDVADSYMENMRSKCEWGYSIPYFLAGICSSHVNNIAYLSERPGITTKDMRYILSQMSPDVRKRYDYDLLKQLYLNHVACELDDRETIRKIADVWTERNIVVLLPGSSTTQCRDHIQKYIQENSAITVAVNFIPEGLRPDVLFFSNIKRYQYWNSSPQFDQYPKILTSNITNCDDEKVMVVNINHLMKQGTKISDSATFLLLRLLDEIKVASVGLTGFDGYSENACNYSISQLERTFTKEQSRMMNNKILDLQAEFMRTRTQIYPVRCITASRFEHGFE